MYEGEANEKMDSIYPLVRMRIQRTINERYVELPEILKWQSPENVEPMVHYKFKP